LRNMENEPNDDGDDAEIEDCHGGIEAPAGSTAVIMTGAPGSLRGGGGREFGQTEYLRGYDEEEHEEEGISD